MFPRIEKVELSEDGKQATITLTGNPDANYFLSSRSIDQNGVILNKTMPKVKVGSIKVRFLTHKKANAFQSAE